jgi:inosose dehydratase
MKIALSKPTYNDEDRRTLFGRFRAAGHDGLQLKARQYEEYLDQPAGFLAELSDDPGVTSALITNDTLDEPGQQRLAKLIDFAVAVGAERIVYCNKRDRDTVDEASIASSARILSGFGARALDRGVKISLHHHFNQPVMYRPDFDVFFEAITPGTVGLTIDTGHLIKCGITDIPSVITDFGSVIDNYHIKDFDGDRWRLLGEGTIDFAPIFDAVRQTGFTGWMCADEESKADLIPAIDISAAFLRSVTAPTSPSL